MLGWEWYQWPQVVWTAGSSFEPGPLQLPTDRPHGQLGPLGFRLQVLDEEVELEEVRVEPESENPPVHGPIEDCRGRAEGAPGDGDGSVADLVVQNLQRGQGLDGVGPGHTIQLDANDKLIWIQACLGRGLELGVFVDGQATGSGQSQNQNQRKPPHCRIPS